MRKLLAQSAFWVVNKHLAKALGSNDAAIVVAHLLDVHQMHPDKELVFCRQKDFMEYCNLSEYTLRKVLNMLEEKNIIYREREKGTMQPVVMYKVQEQEVVRLLGLENASKEINRLDNESKQTRIHVSLHADSTPRNNNILQEELTTNKNISLGDNSSSDIVYEDPDITLFRTKILTSKY